MPTLVALAGSQTIANVEDACAAIRAATSEGGEVEIDLSGVTEADLAFVQLLLAACRSTVAASVRLIWHGDEHPVARVVAHGGLLDLLKPTKGEGQ